MTSIFFLPNIHKFHNVQYLLVDEVVLVQSLQAGRHVGGEFEEQPLLVKGVNSYPVTAKVGLQVSLWTVKVFSFSPFYYIFFLYSYSRCTFRVTFTFLFQSLPKHQLPLRTGQKVVKVGHDFPSYSYLGSP